MIQKVYIKGYQSHVQTTIEFHPHLNVIVGPSNAGKSVILRALKKVIRDLPAGNHFVNKDTDTCEVIVENDLQIKRRIVKDNKGNTKTNEYYVNDQLFGGFGREIPQEVVAALNMPIINFGDNLDLDLHFAGQHDGNFLLDETASVQSKVLGCISGLNVIDGAIQTVKTETRRSTNSLKVVDSDIEQLNLELQKLPDVDALDKQANFFDATFYELEKQHKELGKLQELEKKLIDLVQQGSLLRNEVEALPNLDDLNFDAVKTKINVLTQYKELLSNLDSLNLQIITLEGDPTLSLNIVVSDFDVVKTKINVLTQYKELFDNLNNLNLQITTLENDTVLNVPTCDFESVKSKIKRLNELKQLEITLDQKNDSILQIDNELQKLNIDYIQTTQDWKSLLQELGVCPTCKQPTKDVKF